METLEIKVLNPEAKKMLQDMEDLNLIQISGTELLRQNFINLLSEIRRDDTPTLEEIQEEVKIVRRQMRNGK